MRKDISDYLIHFTKDSSEISAIYHLNSMLEHQTIFGGNGHIRGGHLCVCFSEAPLDAVRNGLVNSKYYSKYSGYGIMVKKDWLFRLGGRPVIYGPSEELDELPSSWQWRTVKFSPISNPPIDFTWEREWRINTAELLFNSEDVSVIVPDLKGAHKIYDLYIDPQVEDRFNWEYEKENFIRSYSQIMDSREAERWFGSPPSVGYFPWKIITLDKSLL